MDTRRSPPRLSIDGDLLRLAGDWTTLQLPVIAEEVLTLSSQGPWSLDAGEISCLDSNGACLLAWLGGADMPAGLDIRWQPLFAVVADNLREAEQPTERAAGRLEQTIQRIMDLLRTLRDHIDVLGQITVGLLTLLRNPARLQLRETLHVIVSSGAMAVPIIALLAFLLGGVLAYQGGLQLQMFGGNIFIVELITLALFREFGPLITAIIVAGRSGAAFTAELATMRGNREIDALVTLGLSPIDRLVLPKWLALVLVMPLLTILANVAGLLGGVLVADLLLNVTFEVFFLRVPEVIEMRHFWVGIGKSVVFGMIIALIACSEGLRAEGDAESIGRNTTSSVVQAIFWVIVLDAVFSILFNVLEW